MGIISTPVFSAEWKTARPGDVGLAGDIAERLRSGQQAGEYQGLHSFLIVRDGRLVVECHFDGADERWGEPLGTIAHGPALLHDVRSVTKSIVGLLYGIALRDSAVPPATAKVADVLPEYSGLMNDPVKRRMTVGHVLSMRMGLEWHEDFAYSNPRNGERQMEAAENRYRYILSLPMADKPGGRWVYSGGSTALLGHLIERGTGQRLEDYARARLFAPLGIAEFEWIMSSDGHASASSGLRLTARGLARIGQMVLDRGSWNGARIVPAGWIATAMKPRAFAEAGLRYGYQWWLGNLVSTAKPWFAAFGNGGQRLTIIPSLRMVIVIFAGNYNAADQWKMPVKLMTRIVMPAVAAS